MWQKALNISKQPFKEHQGKPCSLALYLSPRVSFSPPVVPFPLRDAWEWCCWKDSLMLGSFRCSPQETRTFLDSWHSHHCPANHSKNGMGVGSGEFLSHTHPLQIQKWIQASWRVSDVEKQAKQPSVHSEQLYKDSSVSSCQSLEEEQLFALDWECGWWQGLAQDRP